MVVAQLVRAADCGSAGRGFEPPLSPLADNQRFRCLKPFSRLLRTLKVSLSHPGTFPDALSGASKGVLSMRLPSYRKHVSKSASGKVTVRARVTFAGKDYLLGEYGSKGEEKGTGVVLYSPCNGRQTRRLGQRYDQSGVPERRSKPPLNDCETSTLPPSPLFPRLSIRRLVLGEGKSIGSICNCSASALRKESPVIRV